LGVILPDRLSSATVLCVYNQKQFQSQVCMEAYLGEAMLS